MPTQNSCQLYLRKVLLIVIAVVTLSISTPSQAYTSYFDFGKSIQNTNIQRTFVDSMVNNYTNAINTFKPFVEMYGHNSWAQIIIVQQYEWYKSELAKYSELQSLLNSTKPTVLSTSYKYNYFPMVSRGTEEQASRTETEVEETFGSVVNVYKDITIVYETKVTTKNYKGIFTTRIYSDDTTDTQVSTELLSTNITIETRTDNQREFMRSYAFVEESSAGEAGLTPNVLTVEEYLARPDVNYAGTDMYKQAVWTMNDNINEEHIDTAMQALTNNLELIGAPVAWSRGYTGLGSVIAIFDTGIDVDHPEFTDSILDMKCFTSICDPIRMAGNLEYLQTIDDKNRYSHGTHVAGIAAANLDGVGTTGVAPDAKLLIGKVAYDGGFYDFSATGKAIEWAVNNGADVINISAVVNQDRTYKNSLVEFTPGQFYSTDTRGRDGITYDKYGYNNMLADEQYHWPTVNAMQNNEVVLVVAAGNQRLATSVYPGYLALNEEVGDRVMIAGAWDQRGNGKVISNKAGTVCFDFNNETQTCNNKRLISDHYILAPGRYVASASDGGEYRTLTGSSMAAPAVSGAVAIVHQMWPHMKGENLAKLLLNTTNKEIYEYDVNVHGQGLLDLAEATSPQGSLGIPTTGRVEGATSSVNAISTMSINGAEISSISSLMVIDDYDRDFYVNGNRLNVNADRRTTQTTIAAANGIESDDYQGFTRGIPVAMAATTLNINSDNKSFGISHKFNDLTLGVLKENGTFLGNYANNALINVEGSTTAYVGLNKEYVVDNTTIFGGINLGATKLNVGESMMTSTDTVFSNSANIGAKYTIDNRQFGMVAGLPVAITSGSAKFNVPSNVSVDGDIETMTMTSSLASRSREFDLGIFYNLQLSDSATMSTFIEKRFNHSGNSNTTSTGFGIGYTARF